MQITSAYNAFQTHLALRQHLTSWNYDFKKYQGKVRATPAAYEKRNGRYWYTKLYGYQKPGDMLLANLVKAPKTWIGEIVSDEGYETYLKWSGRQESLSYLFQNELHKLDDDFQTNFISDGKSIPKLINMYLSEEICLETLTLCASISGITKNWMKTCGHIMVVPEIVMRIVKYEPFMVVDWQKQRKALISRFS